MDLQLLQASFIEISFIYLFCCFLPFCTLFRLQYRKSNISFVKTTFALTESKKALPFCETVMGTLYKTTLHFAVQTVLTVAVKNIIEQVESAF